MFEELTIFDFEVFAHDWLAVFKRLSDGEYFLVHNDADELQSIMESDPWLCGFNTKHYDSHILKACLAGFTPEEVKKVNDDIILRNINGWEIPELKGYRFFADIVDLMDDVQQGTSLKSFEAHMGMNIKETGVSFDIDRPLTVEEISKSFDYCRADVNATEKLLYVRLPYLVNKINLGNRCGLTARESLKLTNAKLTAAYLQARQPEKPWTDERQYRFPKNLLRQYIPEEVFAYFNRMYDPSIPDEELFGEKLNIMVGDCPVTIGYGGIHGAVLNYVEETTQDRSIRNKDVASYYPNLIRHMGYASRNMPDPKIYADTIDARVLAKRSMDMTTANALKLVLNTTYGAMGNRYNDLYDPLMMRSVCITGQLFLLELSQHLLAECPTLKIVQLNTDGIMVSFDNSDEAKWQAITQEWQDRTGFELEEDRIKKIVQRDVNNYIEIPEKGGPKVKGGALVRGVLTNGNMDFTAMGLHQWENISGGAFKINNDAVIISRAIIDYFWKGISAAETINRSNELLEFQIISKASSLYSRSYTVIKGEEVPVQKVNRVYATKDQTRGTLYKVHAQTGGVAKIPALPEHCYIDNDNHCGMWVVDREWYIKEAEKKIKEFLGIKPPKVNKRKVNSIVRKCMKLLEEV